jgi:mannose/cellobiose epimerase-like protein (N-acyl-D-glucosamine 2-epimerase family)
MRQTGLGIAFSPGERRNGTGRKKAREAAMSDTGQRDIEAWLMRQALPFWAEHGVDRTYGGFVEELTLSGDDAGLPVKRTRVTARQIYVFSHAYMLGYAPDADLARLGMRYLLDKAWTGPETGFARLMNRDGSVRNPGPDLYDLSFILFGFAWLHRATNDPDARDWMHRTADFIETHLRHPSGAGYLNGLPAEGWRLQNPHMHLTEASLAAYAATGEARFAETARDIAQLCQTKFIDPGSGALREKFADDWSPAPGEDGRIVEPGHQFEWCWILSECRKQLGLDTQHAIRSMSAFAARHGVDPGSGATWMAVRDDGGPLDRSSRTWPNTERLKCAVALRDTFGTDPRPVLSETLDLLFGRYLAGPMPGAWIDAFDADGRPTSRTVPASTLYHLVLAFAEAQRVLRTLGG